LPDLEREEDVTGHKTVYTIDTTLRLGWTPTLEIQIIGSAWNRMVQAHVSGAGDTALAVKWAPAHADQESVFALLGMITLDTGAAAFTNGRPVYSLGATFGREVSAGRTVTMYANLDRSGNANVWTFAPAINFSLTEQFGAYVELGRKVGGGNSATLIGGGMTWLLHDRVQLDISDDIGLTATGLRQQAGCGISVFWK
jgi:hypothetical protein